MSEEEYRQHVNKMNENIGNILKDHDEELMFYVNLVKRFNDICEENDKKEKRINKAIEKIEHYNKYCGYDGTTTIHDKELNELLEILKGGIIEWTEKI